MRASANIGWILLLVLVAATFSGPSEPDRTPLVLDSEIVIEATPERLVGPRPRYRIAWVLEDGVTGHPVPGLNIEACDVFGRGEIVGFVKDQLNWDLVLTSEGEEVWVQSQNLTFVRPRESVVE